MRAGAAWCAAGRGAPSTSRPSFAGRPGGRRCAPREALPAMISARTAAACVEREVAGPEAMARRWPPGRVDARLVREEIRAAAALPSGVSTDSGWNCTPCRGQRAVAHRHQHAAAARRSARARRAARARRSASGSARPSAGSAAPRRSPRAVVLDLGVLPCTGSWRTTRPPNACASDWWPRQTPSVGTPASGKRRIASTEMPASSGVHGAGRDDDAVVAAPSSSSTRRASLRTTSTSAPSSPRYWTRL